MKRQLVRLLVLAFVLTFSSKSRVYASLTDGLVAYFPFNGNANDESGNGHNGSIVGTGVSLANGVNSQPNSAYRFVGASADSYIEGTGVNIANSSLSVSLWFKKDYFPFTSEHGWLLDVGNVGPAGGSLGQNLHIAVNYGNALRFSFFYDDLDVSSPQVGQGAWSHIVCTFDKDTMERRIFVDGNLVANNYAAFGYSGSDYFRLNPAGSASPGQGASLLDQVRFYNRAITPTEVQTLYLTEVPEPSASVILALSALVGAYLFRRKASCKNIVGSALLAASVTCSQAQTTPPNLTNGLVAFYPFEGNANDVSGNGNNATPAGNYQFIGSGLSGGAFRAIGDNSLFYSSGGHALLPTFGSYMNSGFTFSLWVKDEVIGGVPVNGEAYVAFGSLSQTRAEIWLNSVYQGLTFSIDNSSGTGVETNVYATDLGTNWPGLASSWKHLIYTYTPGKMCGYVNGQKFVEVARNFDIFPVSKAALNRHWWDSGASSSARMSCTYDTLRIWNRALTDQEVKQLYNYDQGISTLDVRVKTLRVTMNLELGKNYQIESSTNLPTWFNYGSPFVATNTPVFHDVEVDNGPQFFRLRRLP